jgi:hypothetical protein
LWILALILIISIGVSSNIKDIDAKGEKNIGQRAMACMIAAILACLCIWYIGKDEGKKEARKRFEGQPIYGLPDKGRFKVITQGKNEGGVLFIVLQNLTNEVTLSYCSCSKLLDQIGNAITDKVPEKFAIQKHVEVKIDETNEEGKFVSSNDVYYIFPLEEK